MRLIDLLNFERILYLQINEMIKSKPVRPYFCDLQCGLH